MPLSYLAPTRDAHSTRCMSASEPSQLFEVSGQPAGDPGVYCRWPKRSKVRMTSAGSSRRDIQGSPGREHEIFGSLELAGTGVPGFGRLDQRRIDLRQVALGFQESARDPVDGGRRRIVRDEMAHELGGDEMRRFGTARQIGEHGFTLTLAGLGVGLAEEYFRARLVQVVAKIKAAGYAARRAGPCRRRSTNP